MGKTKIEWCDETVNFITGCSGSCEYCYARGTAERNANMGAERYVAVQEQTGHPFTPTYHANVMMKERERLSRATRPRIVFIGSMSDPARHNRWLYLDGTGRGGAQQFADGIWVQEVIAAFCRELPQHHFILLTKQPQKLLPEWPDNVFVGTSVADEAGAKRRLSLLLKSDRPAAGGLLVSVEPLQGGVVPAMLDGGRKGPPQWVVIGSQTRPALPKENVPGVVRNARELVSWAYDSGIPCFVKDNLVRLGPDYNWPRQFPAAFGRS